MTATQVGEELDEPAPKTHYHVRELERVGLVRLVETRERGGILETYDRSVARGLRVPPSILQQAPPDEVAAAISGFLTSITSGFQTVMSRLIAQNVTDFDANIMTLSGDSLWMTPDESKHTLKAALDLFRPYYARRGVEGEREITLNVISYDARLARQEESERRERIPPIPPIPHAPSFPSIPQVPQTDKSGANVGETPDGKARKVFVAGAVGYSRRDLQEMADRGERIDLTVIGYLSFANDVSVDLARKVIHKLSYRGVLTAPEDVRVALKEKEG
jgi:hypothetical protein